uniref:Putative secreted protein n=1 Tax=Amblyomma cajennense TaxID=34607 RepID=A0A023FBT8_AMBCJ
MKTFMLSALVLVLVFALHDLSRAEEDAAETTAGTIFHKFCTMDPDDKAKLLECLAGKLPDVVPQLEEMGYKVSDLSEKVCNTRDGNFPINLMLLVGKTLPHVDECLLPPQTA